MIEKQIITYQKGSERGFAFVFAIVFLIIALFPLIYNESIHMWGILLSLCFLMIGIFKPTLFKIPNLIWIKFGLFLGSIISPIVISLIYIMVVIPTGLAMKIFRKDPLNQKLNSNQKTFWVRRKDKLQSFKNQF